MIFEPYLGCYSSIFSQNLVCRSWDYGLLVTWSPIFNQMSGTWSNFRFKMSQAYHLNLSTWQITSSLILYWDHITFVDNLDRCLYSLSKQGRDIYIMGDFNVNMMLNEEELNENSLLTLFNSYALFPLINRPTRISTTSAALIDNIFTNVYTDFKSGVLYSDISDHLPIFTVKNTLVQNKAQKAEKAEKEIYWWMK